MNKLVYKLSIFIVPILLLWIYPVEYSAIDKLDEILTASIAISSSSLGFFIAGIAILQTSNISRFYKKLVELGTNKKIMGWFMTAIIYAFLLSFFGIFNLFFLNTEVVFSTILLNIWLALLCASFLSTLFIITLIGLVFTE